MALCLAGLVPITRGQEAASSLQATNRPPAPRRPNIILILADDLGYGDLGCYGQTKVKTPCLDQLATEGMRFTQFYAGSTVCAPSRCSLMTGLHSGHSYIRGNGDQALRPTDLTMAEVLKAGGYHTGLVGKWGLGNENTSGTPQRHGFAEFVGYLDQTHAHDYYTDHLWRYDFRTGYEGTMVFADNQGGRKGTYTHDLFTKAALNFVKINKPDFHNNFRPFFLFLAYTIPHANNEEGRRSGNGMQVPSDSPYSDEPWPQTEKNKAAMITRMDADIGRLMGVLKESKIDENTIVMFTSDNGPHKEGGSDAKFFQSSGKLRGIKRDLYEGGIRVPMIVNWPRRIKPGQVTDQIAAFWDILPTCAEIGGVKPPKDSDGISFLPTLRGQTQTNRHEFLYWEFHEGGFKQAARMGDWKAVRLKPNGPLELYNLKADLAEKTNVAEKEPGILEKFDTYFRTARSESKDWPVKDPPPQKEAGDDAAPGKNPGQ
jgi:arylsulfatase A-like enzyme